MTNQEKDALFNKFQAENNGKFIERVDGNALNQCFDLAIYWCEYLGYPKSIYSGLGSAYQIYTQWSNPAFEKIANDATFIPIKGDTIVWSSSKPGTGGAGHVAVCTGVGDVNTFQAFSQNDPTGSPSVLKTYNYSYVLGVQRLKVTGATPPMDPMIQKKASRYDVLEHDDKGASVDTNKITDAEFEITRQQFKDRKVAGGKWDQTCDLAGVPHSSTPQQVADKFKAMGGCKPEDLAKAKESGRIDGVKQSEAVVHKLLG